MAHSVVSPMPESRSSISENTKYIYIIYAGNTTTQYPGPRDRNAKRIEFNFVCLRVCVFYKFLCGECARCGTISCEERPPCQSYGRTKRVRVCPLCVVIVRIFVLSFCRVRVCKMTTLSASTECILYYTIYSISYTVTANQPLP